METWYLLDAQNQGNTVSLKLLNSETNELKTIQDTTYKPYFYLPHPLSKQDAEAVHSFNAETETTQKTDLFTNQPKEITKIIVANPDLLKKAIRMFKEAWETEIEYTHSYAYDHGIIFGAQHTITQNNHITPVLSLSPEAKAKFNTLYAYVKNTDPMKYAQLERWFAVLNQPVPQAKPNTLGLSKETSPEKSSPHSHCQK